MHTDSLQGNLSHIWNRLAPSSMLLVRYGESERKSLWDERRAEQILAAINMLLLLSLDLVEGREQPAPRPVFRARYREYCDLPLAFDLERVRLAGHTSRMGLLVADDPLQLSLDEIDAMVASGPEIIREVLGGTRSHDKRAQRLRDGMAGILGAFDTLTAGAFVSHLTGVAETLVDSKSRSEDGRSGWDSKERRIKVLVGGEHDLAVKKVVECRHDYVHAFRQPDSDVLPFIALAMAVQVWGNLFELYERFTNHEDVERLIDGAAIARKLSSSEVGDTFSGIVEAIPAGPKLGRAWIQTWLDHGSS